MTKYDVLDGKHFDVRASLVNILFAEKLGALEVLKRGEIAKAVEEEPSDTLLLEDADYEILKGAVSKFPEYGRPHVEFVRRVLEAEKVKVTAVKG